MKAERAAKGLKRPQTFVGGRNFFEVSTSNLRIKEVGTHAGIYKRALDTFMQSEPGYFYTKQPNIETARKVIDQAEEAFIEFFKEFKKDMLSINDTVKHAKSWTDESGWAHTYCGRYTHPEAVDKLVLNYTRFIKAGNKCPTCEQKLEEANAELSQSKS